MKILTVSLMVMGAVNMYGQVYGALDASGDSNTDTAGTHNVPAEKPDPSPVPSPVKAMAASSQTPSAPPIPPLPVPPPVPPLVKPLAPEAPPIPPLPVPSPVPSPVKPLAPTPQTTATPPIPPNPVPSPVPPLVKPLAPEAPPIPPNPAAVPKFDIVDLGIDLLPNVHASDVGGNPMVITSMLNSKYFSSNVGKNNSGKFFVVVFLNEKAQNILKGGLSQKGEQSEKKFFKFLFGNMSESNPFYSFANNLMKQVLTNTPSTFSQQIANPGLNDTNLKTTINQWNSFANNSKNIFSEFNASPCPNFNSFAVLVLGENPHFDSIPNLDVTKVYAAFYADLNRLQNVPKFKILISKVNSMSDDDIREFRTFTDTQRNLQQLKAKRSDTQKKYKENIDKSVAELEAAKRSLADTLAASEKVKAALSKAKKGSTAAKAAAINVDKSKVEATQRQADVANRERALNDARRIEDAELSPVDEKINAVKAQIAALQRNPNVLALQALSDSEPKQLFEEYNAAYARLKAKLDELGVPLTNSSDADADTSEASRP
jgi:hypothetical protein